MIDDPHVEAMRNDMVSALTLALSSRDGEAAFQKRLRAAAEGAALGREKLTDIISLAHAALAVADRAPVDQSIGVSFDTWYREMACRLLCSAMRIAGAMEDRPPGPVN